MKQTCSRCCAPVLPRLLQAQRIGRSPECGSRVNALTSAFSIRKASAADARSVAGMLGDLLAEITDAIGSHAFHFELEETISRLTEFLRDDKYFVFVALDESKGAIGFVSLYESYALYAEGSFGTIAELFVRPEWRSKGVGFGLISRARSFGTDRGWKRLEVTTPPLPAFDRTLAFYEREGFAIAGGRKLKSEL